MLPGPAMRAEVERALAAAYQVSRVELDLTVPAPNVEELALADGVYGEDMPLPEPPPEEGEMAFPEEEMSGEMGRNGLFDGKNEPLDEENEPVGGENRAPDGENKPLLPGEEPTDRADMPSFDPENTPFEGEMPLRRSKRLAQKGKRTRSRRPFGAPRSSAARLWPVWRVRRQAKAGQIKKRRRNCSTANMR